MSRLLFCLFLLLPPLVTSAHAVEVHVTAPALQRTLEQQLFNQAGPNGTLVRHYLRGDATTACSVYADDPHVAFREDRVVVTLNTHAKLGFGKACFGISLSTESRVSFIPEAEGESVGFRDARIEHLSNNRELDMLMEPFLSKKLPQEMKVNAAEMLRNLLVKAPDSTGYKLILSKLKLHSMLVDGQELVVDLDANVRVD